MTRPTALSYKEKLRERCPDNESETHWLLKWAGRWWLWCERDCRTLGFEIDMRHRTTADEHEQRDSGSKNKTVDVMGISQSTKPEPSDPTVWSLEAKVDRNDFGNGFGLTACAMNCLIAPLGVLKPADCPINVGLLEVDLDKLAFEADGAYDRDRTINGVTLTKRARLYNDTYKNQAARYTRQIARSNSVTIMYGGSQGLHDLCGENP